MNKCLIVDDEPLLRKILLKIINGSGSCEAKAVQSGAEALSEIFSSGYDVCFLDINLPDSNGLDIMEKIKEKSPQTRIIIMSASVIDDAMQKAIKGNAYLFIPKPFELSQIKAILKENCAKILGS